MSAPNVYWWHSEVPNFGDELTPLILSHFSEMTIAWSPPEKADIISGGSVLDVMPKSGWTGIVAGCGKLFDRTQTDLTKATVLGLRGKLTAAHVKLAEGTNYVLGDPGLLASELVPVERNIHKLGVVAHWTDVDRVLFKQFAYLKPIEINVSGNPIEVIRLIGSCERIVSSSLHGVVVADSFGLPRRIESFPRMTSQWEGSGFKIHDYNSALGLPTEWGVMQTVQKFKVDEIQVGLFEMFDELRSTINVSSASS